MRKMAMVAVFAAVSAVYTTAEAAKLENVALGKKYEFLPNKPQYGRCTDDGDMVQLTDGEYVKGYFWVQKGCVGWMNYGANPKGVKVDLGKDTPICGFSWNFASGIADVKFPQAIYVYVSLDGENWHFAGDLLGRATTLRVMPPPNEYHVYRAWCDDMYCHGRYVMFVAHQELCCFVDEVEVYRGPDKLLKKPMPGSTTKEPLFFGRTVRFRNRFLRDAERVGLAQDKSVLGRIAKLDIEKFPEDFEAILPLNDLHREILAANSKKLQSAGFTKPTLWTNCRWDNLDPFAVPPRGSVSEKPVEVEMMRNETRGATFNILNPTEEPLNCRVEVTGFGSDTPFDCREVVFSDMSYYRCISGALKPGEGSSVSFEIPAGISKQVWLSVPKPKGAAGMRSGVAVVTLSNGTVLRQRIDVRVHDIDFPDEPKCHAGGWDYCHSGGGMYAMPGNLEKRLALHREMMIDSVWRTGGPDGGKFDEEGNLVPGSLDFRNWDNWVTNICPFARIYCSFLNTGETFFNEKAGTPRFNRMATQWFRAWAEHARENGLNGRRMLMLTVDEPSNEKTANLSIKWMRCIKAAGCKELGVYADPIFNEQVIDKIDPEFWDLCDVVCPHSITPARAKMLRDKGKEIWLYSAFGPSRTFDPVSYYRMQPWRAFVVGGCGTFYWMLGAAGRGGSFVAYCAQKGTDYSPYFAMPTDVMHAKQSMAMMESIEDFEYLSMYAERFGRAKAEKLAWSGIKAHPDNDCDWDRPDMDRTVADSICVQMLRELDGFRPSPKGGKNSPK